MASIVRPPPQLLALVSLFALTCLVLFGLRGEQSQLLQDPLIRIYDSIAAIPSDAESTFLDLLVKPSETNLLPASHYQKDKRGAIDIFEKHGKVVCRIYKVCRFHTGTVYVPRWMQKYSSVLKDRCGLLNFRYASGKSMKNPFWIAPYFDWVGPQVPTTELGDFSRDILSQFFASAADKRSIHDADGHPSPHIRRSCLSPHARNKTAKRSVICTSRPEGRIAHPAVLLGSENETEAVYIALRTSFEKSLGTRLRIVKPSSLLLRRTKLCFRSAVTARTVKHYRVGRSRQLGTGEAASMTAEHCLSAADKAVQKQLDNETATVDTGQSESKTINMSSVSFNASEMKALRSPDRSLFDNKTKETVDRPAVTNKTLKEARGDKIVAVSDTFVSRERPINDLTATEKNESSRTVPNTARSVGHILENATSEENEQLPNFEGFRNETSDTRAFATADGLDPTGNNTELRGARESHHFREERKGDSTTRNPRFKGSLTIDDEEEDFSDVFTTEGGIELFTHRAVRGAKWNYSVTAEPTKHIYGVCRIYRACRGPDGTIVLPNWMKRYAIDLETHCGLAGATYMRDPTFREAYDALLEGPTQSKVLKRNFRNAEMQWDLIGTRVYRAQEQHFVTDFFRNGVHALDALLGHTSPDEAPFQRQCLYHPSTRAGVTAVVNRECSLTRSTEPLRPRLILDDVATAKTASTRYIQDVVGMMPPEGGGPAVTFHSQLSGRGPHSSTCFRSIVLTRNSYPPRDVLAGSEHNVFFERNGISRSRAVPHVRGGTCHVRVTFLKPRAVRGRKNGAGSIANTEYVMAMIQKHASRVPGVEVEVDEFSHEGKAVSTAAHRMQQTEIIVSANDPAMTSMIFARTGTVVVEVQPFGYSTGPYRSFARSLGLEYERVTAKPDVTGFERCARKQYRRGWSRGVREKEKKQMMEALVELFREKSKKSEGLELARRQVNATERRVWMPMERVCARMQSLQVNATHVADVVIGRTIKLCAGAGLRHTLR